MSSSSSASSSAAALLATAAFASGVASGAALYAALERRRRRQALESTAPLDARDARELLAPAASLAELIVRYHENLRRRDPHRGDAARSDAYAVRAQVAPGDVKSQLPVACPESPESYGAIFRDVERVIFPALTHWASPDFFAYFKVCGSDPSVLADMLCAALNVVGFSWVAAPAATELEQVMCDWLAQLLALPACFRSASVGGGVIQGSASESALCALIAARHAALAGLEGDAREHRAARLCVYVSDQTHAIAEKGCMVLDIPHLRVLPTRRGAADVDNFGLAPADVAAAMAADVAAGLVPFFLVPTVGTTSTAAIDPIRALAQVAKQQPFPVWVHVDGAYGGCAAVCPEFQRWFDGAELCDSVCVNAHKWLLVGFDCSVLWVQDRRPLIQALALDPEYLKNDFMTQVNYKDWQVPLGRRFRALKLWFTLRRFGAEGLRAHIRRAVALAQQAEALLVADGRFRIFTPVRMGLVCFHVAFGGRALNEQLLRRLNASGKTFLVHSVVDGVHFLRMAVGGLEVGDASVRDFVALVQAQLSALVADSLEWQQQQRAFEQSSQ